ncbi:MAG: xanthine dehydrogenase family protein molybdopterin-binding subunit [Sphingomonadales bacterium]|nr:xanthine dehydrogenase family protein molybdopterin-binding subunit [Sphingomonadales bacterium]
MEKFIGIENDSPRADAVEKVTGRAKYSAEHRIDNIAYGVFVCSTIAKGTITAIEEGPARAADGVLDVISYKNCPSTPGYEPLQADGSKNPKQWWGLKVLHDNIVRFYGQPVALVVADSLENANAAAQLLIVQYEREAFETDFNAARKDAAKLKTSGNYSRGKANAIDEAAVKVEGEYNIPIEVHSPMELQATIAVWEGDDKLTVYDKTQGPKSMQGTLARLFSIPDKNVRVIVNYVGGAFGNALRGWHNVPAACIAAKKLKRPVKVVLTRPQMFNLTGYRPQSWQEIKMGASADGKFLSIAHNAISMTARYEDFREGIVNASRFLYACDNVQTSYKLLPLDVSVPTWMRGPGEATGCFALESSIDELAYQLKIDPVALRLKNFPEVNPESKLPWSSNYLRDCYEKGKELIGWNNRPVTPGSKKEEGMLVGYGMANGVFGAGRGQASVRAILQDNGILVLQSAVSDMGPGTTTAMMKIAAENLQWPIEKIKFSLGDSDLPPGPTQGGSTTTSTLGTAVHLVCEALKSSLQALAQNHLDEFKNVDTKNIEIKNASVVAGENNVAISTLLKKAQKPSIEITKDSQGTNAQELKHATNSFSCHFVKVHVHPKTMEIKIKEVVTTADAGKIISENTARSQMLGGVVGGIGMALKEELKFDHSTGQIINASFAGYRVPLHTDIPKTTVWFVNKPDPIINPIGAKGLGEIALIGLAAAISNAVYNATGKRVRDLPITPEKLGYKGK